VITLSHGVLPSEADFHAAFEGMCSSKGYSFRNCKRIGNADLLASELWAELDSATGESECTEESLEWASCVLYTLGFEWI
jgi:hypothetical protein